MARSRDSLFIGIGGHIVAIDPNTGVEVWRTKRNRLKGLGTGVIAFPSSSEQVVAAVTAARAAAAAG